MRLLPTALIITAIAVPVFFLGRTSVDAAPPSVMAVTEGRDAATNRNVLVLSGRRVNAFREYTLARADGSQSWDLVVLSKSRAAAVVELPPDVGPGDYELVSQYGRRATTVDYAFTITGGGVLPGRVDAAALDSTLRSDLDDAATLDGQPPDYYLALDNLGAGTFGTERFSAFDDLVAEDKFGTTDQHVAAGDHLHDARYLNAAGDSASGDFSFGTFDDTAISALSLNSTGGNGVFASASGTDGLSSCIVGFTLTEEVNAITAFHGANEGQTVAIDASVDSSSGTAVRAIAPQELFSTGLRAEGFYAVHAVANIDGGFGVLATTTATNGSGAAVRGDSSNVFGAAIQGNNFSTTGSGAYGVRGVTYCPTSYGVTGTALDTDAEGGGVAGFAREGIGVLAQIDGEDGNALVVRHNGASPGESTAATGNYAVFETLLVNRARIDGEGRGYFNGGTTTGGADFAESVAVAEAPGELEPGDVLAVDPTGVRRFCLASGVGSDLVAGVYSTKPGVLARPGDVAHDDSWASEEVPLAITGIVPCKVTDEGGPIQAGDLLVCSSTPGHAMRADADPSPGTVLAKALAPHTAGSGKIEVLLWLR